MGQFRDRNKEQCIADIKYRIRAIKQANDKGVANGDLSYSQTRRYHTNKTNPQDHLYSQTMEKFALKGRNAKVKDEL